MEQRGRFAAIAGLGLPILVLGFVLLHSFHAHLLVHLLLAAGNAALIGEIGGLVGASTRKRPLTVAAWMSGIASVGMIALLIGTGFLFMQHAARHED